MLEASLQPSQSHGYALLRNREKTRNAAKNQIIRQ